MTVETPNADSVQITRNGATQLVVSGVGEITSVDGKSTATADDIIYNATVLEKANDMITFEAAEKFFQKYGIDLPDNMEDLRKSCNENSIIGPFEEGGYLSGAEKALRDMSAEFKQQARQAQKEK